METGDPIDPVSAFGLTPEQAKSAVADAVTAYLAHVAAEEHDFVLADKLRAGGEQDKVCRALALSAKLIGRVLLEDKLTHTEVFPLCTLGVRPCFGRALEQFFGVFYKVVIKLHKSSSSV